MIGFSQSVFRTQSLHTRWQDCNGCIAGNRSHFNFNFLYDCPRTLGKLGQAHMHLHELQQLENECEPSISMKTELNFLETGRNDKPELDIENEKENTKSGQEQPAAADSLHLRAALL